MSASEVSVSLQSCHDCGKLWHTVVPGCPYCGATNLSMKDVAGRGSVYSWTTIFRSLEDPPKPVPYTILAVSLDVGARVYGRYESAEEPHSGDRVVCCGVDRERSGALTFTKKGSA